MRQTKFIVYFVKHICIGITLFNLSVADCIKVWKGYILHIWCNMIFRYILISVSIVSNSDTTFGIIFLGSYSGLKK